ncbi:MAG: methyltransferase domain-containing protein [Sedimentisphaerales bacterium]
MENYDRYKTATAQSYEKKSVMDYLVRIPSNKTLIPLIDNIKGKKVLDVGLGTGWYTKLLLENNNVIGIDRNPHLCSLPIKVHQGDATQLCELTGDEKFDVVFSTWMTEYLEERQLQQFFSEAKKTLKDNGRLITTVISKGGFGFLYIAAARTIRGIVKYNYSRKQVLDMLKEAGFADIKIINLNSWFYIPWAYVVVAG